MVFYRKYRPQTIKELDSEAIREVLSSFLVKDRVPQVFLFTGPKGVGKTSTARIVAKSVNCEKKETVEPCNKCTQCISITNGTNLDILEIDGASNRGIDEVRDLRDKIRLVPLAAKKKVYIIDEVHMLTTEAFNALLKTLEEPPPHALFILCTTEPQKIPPTIVSRCFHIAFDKALEDELIRSFKRIAKKEKMLIEREAFLLIARLSEGSFRDGAKILEGLAVHSNGKITEELIEKKYKVSSTTYHIAEMLTFFAKKDLKAGLKLVDVMVKQGVDMKYFLEQTISYLHKALLAEIGVGTKSAPPGLKIEEIKELIELLMRAYGDLKYAVLPQLPLELVIIEWGQKSVKIKEETVLRSPFQFGESSNASVPASRHSAGLGVRSPSATLVKTAPHEKAPRATQLEKMWQELIEKIKSHNHSIAGVLRGCSLKSYDGKKVVIETGYKFHKDRLQEEKTRSLIEKMCREISGNKVNVSVLLKN